MNTSSIYTVKKKKTFLDQTFFSSFDVIGIFLNFCLVLLTSQIFTYQFCFDV